MLIGGCCGASMRVKAGGGIMSIEDVITLGIKPDHSMILRSINNYVWLDDKQLKLRSSKLYDIPPSQYDEMVKVTPTGIIRLGWLQDIYIHEALVAQIGELNYAVAALCIWIKTKVGQYVCSQLPIHKVPLHLWPEIVKPFADDCRRMGQIFGLGNEEIEYAFSMRKMTALCGRTDEDADWLMEVNDRTSFTTSKAACIGGVVSTAAYETIRDHWLGRIAHQATRMVAKRAGSIDEFWSKRWWNTPRGTTSLGAITKRFLKNINNKSLIYKYDQIKKQ